MAKRQIIRIDEALCNGCGQCILACAEGALEIVDGKARVVAELLCDGLGACIGECPEGALVVEVREADEFDEAAVEARLRELGRPSLAASGHDHSAHGARAHAGHDHGAHAHAGHDHGAHSAHAHAGHDHGTHGHAHAGHHHEAEAAAGVPTGCPGSLARELRQSGVVAESSAASSAAPERADESLLQNWPVQLGLINPNAPFLRHADLLIAADCAPAAYRLFHEDFLQGRSLVIACPKLDDAQAHFEKLAELFQTAQPRSVNVVRMEVPCCSGLVAIARKAAEVAGLEAPVQEIVVGVGGECLTPSAMVSQPAMR